MKPRKTTTTKIAFLEKITNYELQNLILGQSIASSWVFLGLLYSLPYSLTYLTTVSSNLAGSDRFYNKNNSQGRTD